MPEEEKENVLEEEQKEALNEEDAYEEKEEVELLSDSEIESAFPSNSGTINFYGNKLRCYKLLSYEQEQDLFNLYHNADDDEEKEKAKEVLIYSNIRLVISIAMKINRRRMNLEDVIQEGIGGLMTALDKFDSSRGFKFSTYATWWIRQFCIRAVTNQNDIVRIPVHMQEKIKRITKAKTSLQISLGREPTNAEIAEETELEESTIEDAIKVCCDKQYVSLDSCYDVLDNTTMYHDVIGDDVPTDAEVLIEKQEKHQKIQEILAPFKLKERRVMQLRYGIDPETEEHTLDETAQILYKEKITKNCLTRERVRQIEMKTLNRLRNNSAFVQWATEMSYKK